MIMLTSERLVIRDWSPADVDRVYEIYSRPEVARFLPSSGLPMIDPQQATDRVAAWRQRNAEYPGRYGIWAIERCDDGLVVGAVLLKLLPGREEGVVTGDVEVGWHLHPDEWGNGYATEAARAVVERELSRGTEVIHAVVLPGNDASMAVARRLGMTHVGRRTTWYGGLELETFVLHRPA